MTEEKKRRDKKIYMLVREGAATAGAVSLLCFIEPRFLDGVCEAH